MKPSTVLFAFLTCLASLATAAPIGQPLQKRQMGFSFLSTGVIAAPTPGGALAAEATAASSAEATATESAASAEATATETSSVEATATESAVAEVVQESASEKATETSAAEAQATAEAAAAPSANIDIVVLNLAFTLEQLEGKFYEEALNKFSLSDMVNAGLSEVQATIIIEEIQGIQRNEAVHASVLSDTIKALGAEPFNGCQFNFGATLDDPLTFLSVARTLEAVGVAAYAGAASLISDPALLTAAASILTLEARHQSLLNTFNSGSFAAQSFDIALGPEQILALAGGFLSNCQASDLGLTSNLPLSITDVGSQSTRFQVGSELAFSSSEEFAVEPHFCQMFVGGAPDAVVFEANRCVVPEGIDGPVAIFLTTTSTPLASNLQIQNKAAIAFGPGFIFVDGKVSTLSTLFTIQNVNDSIASANLGGYYVNRRKGNRNNKKNDNNNYEQTIKVVVQTKTIVTKTVTEVIINKGDNNKGDDKKGYNAYSNEHKSYSAYKRPSSNYRRTYRKPEKRGNGDLREIGWSMVRRA